MARELRRDEIERLVETVASAFGYPKDLMQGVLLRFREELSDTTLYPGDTLNDLLSDELMHRVWWEESVPAALEDPFEAEEYSQSVLTLAAQWAGFYATETGLGFGHASALLHGHDYRVRYYVDINDGGGAVVLAQLDANLEPTEFKGVVFASHDEHTQAESDYQSLQMEQLKVDEGTLGPESYQQLVDTFGRRYPYFISQCGRLLREGFAVPAVDLPRLSDGTMRSLGCLTMASSVAQALVGKRAPGEVPDRLSELAASERSDDDTVPELLLRPLGRVVMGDHQGAAEAAREILDHELGVPLTRRWARRILERPEGALLDSDT